MTVPALHPFRRPFTPDSDARPTGAASPLAGRRILVIAGDAVSQAWTLAALRAAGAEPMPAETVEQALVRIPRDRPDALVLDLAPGEAGLRALASLTREGAAPVVVLGDDAVRTAVEAMRRGAADFVVRPASPSALVGAMAEMLLRAAAPAPPRPLAEAPAPGDAAAAASGTQRPDALLGHAGDEQWNLARLERAFILQVLTATRGHQSRAAARLGIDRRTLYRKLREYGVR